MGPVSVTFFGTGLLADVISYGEVALDKVEPPPSGVLIGSRGETQTHEAGSPRQGRGGSPRRCPEPRVRCVGSTAAWKGGARREHRLVLLWLAPD